jgi:hypothetical protein
VTKRSIVIAASTAFNITINPASTEYTNLVNPNTKLKKTGYSAKCKIRHSGSLLTIFNKISNINIDISFNKLSDTMMDTIILIVSRTLERTDDLCRYPSPLLDN